MGQPKMAPVRCVNKRKRFDFLEFCEGLERSKAPGVRGQPTPVCFRWLSLTSLYTLCKQTQICRPSGTVVWVWFFFFIKSSLSLPELAFPFLRVGGVLCSRVARRGSLRVCLGRAWVPSQCCGVVRRGPAVGSCSALSFVQLNLAPRARARRSARRL